VAEEKAALPAGSRDKREGKSAHKNKEMLKEKERGSKFHAAGGEKK